VKNGVEWDVAMALNYNEAMALSVVFHEMDGRGEFDWDSMRFRDPK
jgi:hypothetical protein